MAVVVVMVMLGSACSGARGTPLRFRMQASTVDSCAAGLVRKARQMGYVETMADLPNGFFSVQARTALGGHPFTGATSRNVKRARKASAVRFNALCDESGAVTVTAVSVDGPMNDNSTMAGHLRREFDAYGSGLMDPGGPAAYQGAEQNGEATQPPPPPPPPPGL